MTNFLNTMLLCDFYKLSHRLMYPQGMEYCYSTWTPRASRMEGITEIVHFGTQMFLRQLDERFDREFFEQPKDQIVADYKRIIKNTLGVTNPDTKHIEDLHDLGYLPLLIKSLPEGTIVPLRVPTMTVQNTDPRFFWLTNYIETLASCTLWQPTTSATVAREYRKILDNACAATGGDPTFVQFQGHDFSMRGMSSLESAVASGMGHLLFFTGTDTVPAIQGAEYYYGANVEKELVGNSIPATEHSIQCAYGDDLKYLHRMMSEVHPEGMVSIVSDGYDFWDVMGRVLPALKDKIMVRNGKVVIRPDSGDPVKIICGDLNGKTELERKGAIEVLWDTFGGMVNAKGFKQLDSHIGLIYGDAITLRRADEIVNRLAEKGFASTNVVFGIGSYTYQYNTRDTFGFAMKSTLCVINSVEKQIFKDPKTDDGIKKSLKGRVCVFKGDGKIYADDGFSLNEDLGDMEDLLETVYNGGYLTKETTFGDIRKKVQNG